MNLTPNKLASSRVLSPSHDWRKAQTSRTGLVADREDEALLKLFDEPDHELEPREHDRLEAFEERLAVARDYVAMFKDYSALLSATLLFATALGEFFPSPSGSEEELDDSKRLIKGVELLKTQLRFGAVTTAEERLAALSDLLAKATLFPGLQDSIQGIGQFSFEDAETWREAFWTQAARIRERYRNGRDRIVSQATEDAWNQWKLRFKAYLERGELSFAPRDFDLVCDAAGVSPGGFLEPDLKRLNLLQWSDLLTRALGVSPDGRAIVIAKRRAIPVWVAVPAAVRLNLSWLILRLAESYAQPGSKEGIKPEEDEEISQFLAVVEDNRERLERARQAELAMEQVLVVASEQPEMVKRWRVDNKIGALALTPNKLSSLGRLLPRSLFEENFDDDMERLPAPENFLRLYETDPKSKRLPTALERLGSSTWNRGKQEMHDIFMVEEDSSFSTSQMLIPRPKNLAEAVKLSNQLLRARKQV